MKNWISDRFAFPGAARLLTALFGIALLQNAPAAPVVTTNTLVPGTRFATPYYVYDSGVPGPTMMIVGGVHGNEPAGANAAEVIRHWTIDNGKMIVVPRANVPGLQANKRLIPGLSTNLSNLNRNYPRAGKEEPPRGEPAESIWALALKYKPAWLLDLHEGYDFHQVNEKSVGSSVIVFPEPKGHAAADLMLAAVNATITKEELKFVRREMPIDGSLARAGGEHLHIPSMTLETTSKQPMARRVRQQEILVHCLLHHLGMMGLALPAESFVAQPESPSNAVENAPARPRIRVALYKGPGTGSAGPPSLMERLNHAPDSSINQITPEEIGKGALSNYDVVIFGGGSGSKEAEGIGEVGRDAVRKFVGEGGGYIGICAGAYLATSGYPWSLGLVNAHTISPKWQRGKGTVKVQLTGEGRGILGERSGTFDVHYANGPVVRPDDKADLPPFTTLAYFRTEMAEHDTPAGVMVDSPAIFAGTYKLGRAVCISPHPEQTKGLEDIVPSAVIWVTSKAKTVAEKPAPKAE